MCGIAGYATLTERESCSKLLRKLNDGLKHRGPDDEGFFESNEVGLAMRRLSIVDIAGGHQPIGNEDGSIQVVFNGEIYNYVELREQLEARGHRLTTLGDTEVLVHLYEDFGTEMLSHLRGMFAFALWDARQNKLFLARDRLGKKPLCYAALGKSLLFCSEIFPLAQCEIVSKEIDPVALEAYLAFGYVPAPRTILQGIRKLPPAHYLTWQGGEWSTHRYWRLEFAPKLTCDYTEAKELVRAKLDESIRLRLRSDVPVGLLLSGGIDSNAILARLARGLGRTVRTFTIGFAEKRYDESELARQSACRFGAEHTELRSSAQLLDLLPALVRHYGEPFADKSALPSFLVCQLTRGQVKVALNGDGGDEAFAGYAKYRLALWQKLIANLAPRSLSLAWTKRLLAGTGLLGGRPARHLRQSMLPELDSVLSSEFFAGTHFASLTTPELRTRAGNALEDSLTGFWDGPRDPVDRMLAWDCEHYLPDDLLVKVDIASMAHSLEVRSPLLDHELVELCARLPADWKVRNGRSKILLRDLVEADLPPELLSAPKRGFSVPLEEWWRGDARGKLRAWLAELHPALRSLIDGAYTRRLLEEHQQGTRNHAQRLWCLCVLNSWAFENCRA